MFKILFNNEFPYINVGSEDHGRATFRLWLSNKIAKLADENGYINLPINGKITLTEKGNYVLKPHEHWILFNYLCPCGYRGKSWFENHDNIISDEIIVLKYYYFESQRGSLGISEGILVNLPSGKEFITEWSRNGRLYGKPNYGFIKIRDNELKVYEGITPSELSALEGE